MCNLTYSEIVRHLCEAVVNEEKILRVHGVQSKYRCKATYSLHPELCTSPLTMDIVNEVSRAVNEFRLHESNFSKHFALLFSEVCVKVTRANELMLKVVFINEFVSAQKYAWLQEGNSTFINQEKKVKVNVNEVSTLCKVPPKSTLWEWWVNSDEKEHFVCFLQNKFANLKVIVAHVREPCEPFSELHSSENPELNEIGVQKKRSNENQRHLVGLLLKPDKSCSYISLTNDHALTITEYTPNGVPFELSADAFCEVNHAMETAIYHTIVEFLCLENSQSTSSGVDADMSTIKTIRHAFISGRDVNSVTRTFERFYDSFSVATTCPVVYKDTQLNKIPCAFVKKCALGAFFTNEMHKLQEEVNHLHSLRNEENVQVHVLITAGRHGIHPATALSFVQLSLQQKQKQQQHEYNDKAAKCKKEMYETEDKVRLTDFIYISCNVVSLARDLHILKEGYIIHHIRTFDFFPGSSYVMTVVHLRPLHLCASGWCKPLLVIPIGAPCVGKSICGKALSELFISSQEQFKKYVQQHNKQTKTKTTKSNGDKVDGVSPACIPHSTAPIGSNVDFTHFERDMFFHMCRERSMSLKAARKETHMALISTLQEHCTKGLNNTNNINDKNNSCNPIRQTERVEQLQQSAIPQKEFMEVQQEIKIGALDAESRNANNNYADAYFDVQRMSTWPARRIVYLDSTNGSTEARALYKGIWQEVLYTKCDADSEADSNIFKQTEENLDEEINNNTMMRKEECEEFAMPSVLELFFITPPINEILCRMRMRSGHPSFPESVEGQQKKVHDIVNALEMDVKNEGRQCCVSKALIECSDNTCETNGHNDITKNDETNTIVQVVVHVIAHLLFAPELASLLAPATIKLLLHNKYSITRK